MLKEFDKKYTIGVWDKFEVFGFKPCILIPLIIPNSPLRYLSNPECSRDGFIVRL